MKRLRKLNVISVGDVEIIRNTTLIAKIPLHHSDLDKLMNKFSTGKLPQIVEINYDWRGAQFTLNRARLINNKEKKVAN